jgi:hypothetical protein
MAFVLRDLIQRVRIISIPRISSAITMIVEKKHFARTSAMLAGEESSGY